MQWEYKIRPPRLPDGVAVPLTKEALRAVQDALPLHKALLARHANATTLSRLRHPHGEIHLPQCPGMATGHPSRKRMARLASIPDAIRLVVLVLDQ